MWDEQTTALAAKLVAKLAANQQTLTTAESCTGGLVAAAITSVSGSSAVFHQGIVSYANEVKHALLGVSLASLEQHGAVSEQVAKEMAEGARALAKADFAVAITGIAGPSGGTAEKPVGLVFIAVASAAETLVEKYVFSGDREAVRLQSCRAALAAVLQLIG